MDPAAQYRPTDGVSRNVVDRRAAATHGIAALIAIIVGLITGRVSAPKVDPDRDLVSATSTALDRAQDFWARELGGRWHDARVVLIDRPEGTPCGVADQSSGPFYCPGDHRIYLDLSFLRAVEGELARAYVIAHEIGHHVQELLGEDAIVVRDSVAIELEADCYAGRWMRDEVERGRAADDDIAAAVAEAMSVGDDRICPRCSAETWTHGSAQMRAAAVSRGAAGGDCR